MQLGYYGYVSDWGFGPDCGPNVRESLHHSHQVNSSLWYMWQKKTTISQRGKVNTPYRQQQLLQTHAQFQNKTLTILFLTLLPAFTGQPLSLINLVKE